LHLRDCEGQVPLHNLDAGPDAGFPVLRRPVGMLCVPSEFDPDVSLRARLPVSVCRPATRSEAHQRYVRYRGQGCIGAVLGQRGVSHAQSWGDTTPKDTEELKEYVILGMNFPPSMFQIHLQFIHFPLLPFHDSQLQKGEHFTYRRFFPLGYLQKALALGDAVKMENVTMETDLETILEKVKAAGVDYDVFHAAQIKKAHGLQNRLAGTAWKEDCFAYRVHGDQVTEKGSDGNFEVKPDMCSKEVQKGDAKALQNYGRPYKDDKPTGTYYKYAKEPKDVIGFCDVSR
ncbi:unnamed protein product, partial [Polarella glacialis]